MPFRECLDHEVDPTASQIVWQGFGTGGTIITREGGKPFMFAAETEVPPTVKLDAERLKAHPEIIDRFLGLCREHPCVRDADVLSFAPNGMAYFAEALGHLIGKKVIHLVRPAGAPRTDIRYVSPTDEALAREVSTVCALEDVCRTGFSVHATARVLYGTNPDLEVHSLSLVQRDTVDPAYETPPGAVTFHTFVQQAIPLTIETFRQQFPDLPVTVVE